MQFQQRFLESVSTLGVASDPESPLFIRPMVIRSRRSEDRFDWGVRLTQRGHNPSYYKDCILDYDDMLALIHFLRELKLVLPNPSMSFSRSMQDRFDLLYGLSPEEAQCDPTKEQFLLLVRYLTDFLQYACVLQLQHEHCVDFQGSEALAEVETAVKNLCLLLTNAANSW